MLKNDELKLINDTTIILIFATQFLPNDETLKKYVGKTKEEIDNIINNLEDLYRSQAMKKIAASEKSNAWNKAHPDKHSKHNRDYEKRKRLKGGGIK